MLHIVATLEETDEVCKALGIRNCHSIMSVRIACSGLLLSRHELKRMKPSMLVALWRLWQEVNEWLTNK